MSSDEATLNQVFVPRWESGLAVKMGNIHTLPIGLVSVVWRDLHGVPVS